MKAVLWTAYGPPEVLQLTDLRRPEPKDNEVLIRVHAATVTAGDCEARELRFPLQFRIPIRLYIGLTRPTRVTILGQELAGEIAGVGRNVTRFKVGDAVFSATYFRFSAYAEYACLPEAYPRLKPANLTYEEAAALPTGGINAMHFVRKAGIRPGERLLINGAGGSIGTCAIQIARHFGAEVVAVDSAGKLELLRSLGADRVIDYTRQDFTRLGETFDAIIDVAGTSPFSRSVNVLTAQGRYVLGNPRISSMLRGRWASLTTGKRVIFEMAAYRDDDYDTLLKLVEAGVVKSVIDRRYPLSQTAEAHRYVESGQKKGNVIITMDR